MARSTWASVAVLLLASSPAAAEQESGGIVYEAPLECPPRSALIEAIEARKAPAPEVDHRTFRVAIERGTDGAFEGRLEVVGTSHVPRLTRGTDCAAVVRTLAVFVVIARAPESGDGGEPEGTPPPSPHVSPPVPSVSSSPPPRTPPPPRGSTHLRYGANVRPSLLIPSSSSANATVATGVRVQSELAWLPERFPVAPLGRLSFGTASFDAGASSGSTSFRFRTARFEACAAIEIGHSLELQPCIGGEYGDLVATTSNLPVAVRASTRWEAATIGGGLRWAILPWVSLGADLVVLLPFTRRRFGFVDPIQVVYAVPAAFIDLGAVLGVVARFD